MPFAREVLERAVAGDAPLGLILDQSKVTLPRQTGPDGKFENHLEAGYDDEDAEAVHGGVQSCGGGPAG